VGNESHDLISTGSCSPFETPKHMPLFFFLLSSSSHDHPSMNLVEWAIALHGMYKSVLVFISIFKQKNLYIVGCVQSICDITAYFLLPELKYFYEK
jgi:hypothetical protein